MEFTQQIYCINQLKASRLVLSEIRGASYGRWSGTNQYHQLQLMILMNFQLMTNQYHQPVTPAGLELDSKKSLGASVEWRLCAILGPSWSQYTFTHFLMLFYQQEFNSSSSNLKPITSKSLCIHAYTKYTAMERQPIIDNFARKMFLSP